MKNQALFSSKDKSKELKCRLLKFLFGALRVNVQCRYDFKTAPSHSDCLVYPQKQIL